MRRVMRFGVGVLVCASCLLAFGTVLAAGSAVPERCPTEYRVRWGDTLRNIAAHYGVSLADLLQLNPGRIWNPDHIFVGQVICVPAPRTVALEATYGYTPQGDEAEWNLTTAGGLVGRRAALPIIAVEMVSTTAEITATFAAPSGPVFLGVRNAVSATTYTLVAIGDGQQLARVALTPTTSLQAILPPPNPLLGDQCQIHDVKALGVGEADSVRLMLRMETSDGTFFPFEITHFAIRPDLELAGWCYQSNQDLVGFALFPADPGQPEEYRLVMRLTGNVIGPPGATRALRCASWPRSGWFYRWLRGWYGCRN